MVDVIEDVAPKFTIAQVEYLERIFGNFKPVNYPKSINEGITLIGAMAEASGAQRVVRHIRALAENVKPEDLKPNQTPTAAFEHTQKDV